MLLFYEFPYFLYQLILGTIGISIVLIYNIAIAINDEDVWYHLNAKCTLEIAVWVEKNVVFPAIFVNHWLHLVYVLSLIY